MDCKMLDSIVKYDAFSDDQIQKLETCIADICTVFDTVTNGKFYSKNYRWDFYSDEAQPIFNIISPHLPKNTVVARSHILESFYPYELHTDIGHAGSTNIGEYTILIPLDDYNSQTFVFNEYSTTSNEFEDFKKDYTGDLKLKIPREDVLKLTHLHPKDVLHLSLKEKFIWKKGNLFAFDRRYYHCSDNYLKSGHTSKRAILIFTEKES